MTEFTKHYLGVNKEGNPEYMVGSIDTEVYIHMRFDSRDAEVALSALKQAYRAGVNDTKAEIEKAMRSIQPK